MAHATASPVRLPIDMSTDAPPRRKRRLLLVTEQLSWPIDSGNALRTWNFIRALRDEYDVSLIHACRTPPDRDVLAQVLPHFSRIWSVADDAHPAEDTLRQTVSNKVRMIPWEIAQSHRPRFAEAIARVVMEEQFDVVLARYIYQARYLFGLAGRVRSRLVVDVDDIETVKIQRLQRLAPPDSRIERLRLDLNNWIFAQYHKRSLPAADLCIVCSEDDRRYLLDRGWSSRVAVVPNAIEVKACGGAVPAGSARTLLFCGGLSYPPNVDGIRWFVRDVLPHIKAREPDVSVLIVGRSAGAAVKALASDPAVRLHEDVPDVAPFYQQATVVVVPVRSGSGTRLKVLEAGACRRPVVSTTIGVEGLGMVPGRHCLIADDAVAFADRCVELLRDRGEARRLAVEHYEHVRSTYDTSCVQEGIRRLFREVADRSGR